MAKTIDVSGWPMLAFQCVLGSVFVFGGLFVGAVLGWQALQAVGVTVPYTDGTLWLAVFGAPWIALTWLWVRHLRRADGEWWGPIPREQYLGRFAGGGGLARHSWERAVERLPDDGDD
ncbi:hypothetical protein ACFQMA_06695 [Halosimplex aquaticum]|uniref:PrgI family protein n=1 Tax=Halosimplex aquaticum TaxID=3026162 RepID=A0ABD5Y2I4_9EURY|nr:hypothetical protein [Halosimplex aquaticum]